MEGVTPIGGFIVILKDGQVFDCENGDIARAFVKTKQGRFSEMIAPGALKMCLDHERERIEELEEENEKLTKWDHH